MLQDVLRDLVALIPAPGSLGSGGPQDAGRGAADRWRHPGPDVRDWGCWIICGRAVGGRKISSGRAPVEAFPSFS